MIEVSVDQIDARTRLGQLNHLEREVAAGLPSGCGQAL